MPDDERVEKATQRLRELEASGVGLVEILSGEAGVAFIRDDCAGDPEVAAAAFARVHSPSDRGYGQARRLFRALISGM